jgi:23S rRNA (uracil1939-C5)-methyltransferase
MALPMKSKIVYLDGDPPPQGVEVRVRNLAFGGHGVGEVCGGTETELLGIATFVPYTAPGELVRALVEERKAKYLRGALSEVIEPSPNRITPECRHFGVCGGCEIQHLSYDFQLQAKFEMLRSALAMTKCKKEILDVLQPISPSRPYHYRRRISLHIDSLGSIGLYRSQSRSVVPIQECPISVDEIERSLESAKALGFDLRGRVTSLIIEADPIGIIVVLKSPYDLGRSEQQVVLEKARRYFENVVLLNDAKELGGFGRQIMELPLDRHDVLSLRVPAGFFSQVNWDVNLRLIEWVRENAKPGPGMTILDLYAGAGNFALPIARAGARTTAVELDKRLVALGRQNVSRYGLERDLSYHESSVERFLESNEAKKKYDLVICDPPRSGLGRLVHSLSHHKKMIFISCHLPSFVRDIKALSDSGYKVETIQPFDMFAQTSYLEIAASLARN